MLYVLEGGFLVVIEQSVNKSAECLFVDFGVGFLCQYADKWRGIVSQIFSRHLNQENEEVRLGKGVAPFDNLAHKVCHEDDEVHEFGVLNFLLHLLVRVIVVLCIVPRCFRPGYG